MITKRDKQIFSASNKEGFYAFGNHAFRRGAYWSSRHPWWHDVKDEVPEEERIEQLLLRTYDGRMILGSWHDGKFGMMFAGVVTHWMRVYPPEVEEGGSNG
jgi:hypothetical protein